MAEHGGSLPNARKLSLHVTDDPDRGEPRHVAIQTCSVDMTVYGSGPCYVWYPLCTMPAEYLQRRHDPVSTAFIITRLFHCLRAVASDMQQVRGRQSFLAPSRNYPQPAPPRVAAFGITPQAVITPGPATSWTAPLEIASCPNAKLVTQTELAAPRALLMRPDSYWHTPQKRRSCQPAVSASRSAQLRRCKHSQSPEGPCHSSTPS